MPSACPAMTDASSNIPTAAGADGIAPPREVTAATTTAPAGSSSIPIARASSQTTAATKPHVTVR